MTYIITRRVNGTMILCWWEILVIVKKTNVKRFYDSIAAYVVHEFNRFYTYALKSVYMKNEP